MTTTLTKNMVLRSGKTVGIRYNFPDEVERVDEQKNNMDIAREIDATLNNEYVTKRIHVLSELDQEYAKKRDQVLSELDDEYANKRDRNFTIMQDNNRHLDRQYRSVYNKYIIDNSECSEILKRRPNFTFESAGITIGEPLTYNGRTCYVYDGKTKVCIDGENGILILSASDAAKRVNPNAQSGSNTWRYNGILLKDLSVC